jgi:hypothetical protein
MRGVNGRGYSVQAASGSGRIWKWTTLGFAPFPVSLWNGVRVPQVVQTPFPFQPAFVASLAKGPFSRSTTKTSPFY